MTKMGFSASYWTAEDIRELEPDGAHILRPRFEPLETRLGGCAACLLHLNLIWVSDSDLARIDRAAALASFLCCSIRLPPDNMRPDAGAMCH